MRPETTLVSSETTVTIVDVCRSSSPTTAFRPTAREESGLGLEAQRSARRAIHPGRFPAGRVSKRLRAVRTIPTDPQLTAALAMCRTSRATLVIAKLDRLARDVHFISGLMKAGVDFVAVDMPQANKLTVHILAAVAEHEREAISQRTKAALHAAKARGTQLGNPRWQDSIERARGGEKPHSYPSRNCCSD